MRRAEGCQARVTLSMLPVCSSLSPFMILTTRAVSCQINGTSSTITFAIHNHFEADQEGCTARRRTCQRVQFAFLTNTSAMPIFVQIP